MLYQKHIDSITWEDIESFCAQGTPENAVLYYKADFPGRLENTISAMANTLGGLIIIGVGEDSQGKPIAPIAGIEPGKHMAERVMNIVLSNISPPIFPEIAVCSNGTKAAIVIRIPESHETPHAIAHNTRVYRRTGNRNSPEQLATIDQIAWLTDRRQKSINLRTALIEDASRRHADLVKSLAKPEKKSHALLKLILTPLFPRQEFVRPPDMNSIYPQIRVREYYNSGAEFPLPDGSRGRLLANGIVASDKSQEYKYYTELSSYGLYYYAQFIADEIPAFATPIICTSEVCCRIDEFLDSAIKFYDAIGFRGGIHYAVELRTVGDCRLVPFTKRNALPFASFEGESTKYEAQLRAEDLSKSRTQWIIEPLERICWAYNYNVTPQDVEGYLAEHKPKPKTAK